MPKMHSFFRTDADNIVIETVKKAEDSTKVVVRMYEAENKRTTCNLMTSLPMVSCMESDLMENPERTLSANGNAVTLEFRPFEIKTVLLDLAD